MTYAITAINDKITDRLRNIDYNEKRLAGMREDYKALSVLIENAEAHIADTKEAIAQLGDAARFLDAKWTHVVTRDGDISEEDAERVKEMYKRMAPTMYLIPQDELDAE